MQEEVYIKEYKIIEMSEEDKKVDILKSVIKTKMELNNANINFEYAQDDMIDYYSYKIKALQSKLNYLLKDIKEQGLVLDMVNSIDLSIAQDDIVS